MTAPFLRKFFVPGGGGQIPGVDGQVIVSDGSGDARAVDLYENTTFGAGIADVDAKTILSLDGSVAQLLGPTAALSDSTQATFVKVDSANVNVIAQNDVQTSSKGFVATVQNDFGVVSNTMTLKAATEITADGPLVSKQRGEAVRTLVTPGGTLDPADENIIFDSPMCATFDLPAAGLLGQGGRTITLRADIAVAAVQINAGAGTTIRGGALAPPYVVVAGGTWYTLIRLDNSTWYVLRKG